MRMHRCSICYSSLTNTYPPSIFSLPHHHSQHVWRQKILPPHLPAQQWSSGERTSLDPSVARMAVPPESARSHPPHYLSRNPEPSFPPTKIEKGRCHTHAGKREGGCEDFLPPYLVYPVGPLRQPLRGSGGLMRRCNGRVIVQSHTVDCMSTLHPLSSSIATMRLEPNQAAHIIAVKPTWRQPKGTVTS